jgi:hypothetical protein
VPVATPRRNGGMDLIGTNATGRSAFGGSRTVCPVQSEWRFAPQLISAEAARVPLGTLVASASAARYQHYYGVSIVNVHRLQTVLRWAACKSSLSVLGPINQLHGRGEAFAQLKESAAG